MISTKLRGVIWIFGVVFIHLFSLLSGAEMAAAIGGTSLSGLWSATAWRIGTGVSRIHSTQRLVIWVQVWLFIPFRPDEVL